jgi:monovalent cation/hydrogen antiporter
LSLLNYLSRIQGVNVWNSLVFILNGLVFILIGLQLPAIVNQLGETSIITAISYGLIISLVLIVTRLLCTYGAAGFTMFISRFITVAEARPGWKVPLIFGWAGIRGVVSLAAALSIPLLANDGQLFPYRNLILFITFIVILVTLVLQGLTLPWLIRKLNIDDREPVSRENQEKIIQKKIAYISVKLLEEKFIEESSRNEHISSLKSRFKTEMDSVNRDLTGTDNNSQTVKDEFQKVYLDILQNQRNLLDNINHNSEFDEELIRKYQLLIDMEEYKLHEKYSR